MVASPEQTGHHYISLQEYLEIEEESGLRHEWIAGELRAMAGAAPDHVTIVSNINGVLRNQLRGKSCQPWSNDIRVKVPSGNRYFPDVIVACQPFEWDDEMPHTLLNPQIVIEVFSPSTSDIDRGEKLRHYVRIPALRHYIMVASQEMFVTHIHRSDDNDWRLQVYDQPDQELTLSEYSCRLPLAEVYERLEFEKVSAPAAP